MVEEKSEAEQGAETNTQRKKPAGGGCPGSGLYFVLVIILINAFGMLMAYVLPALQHYRYGPGIEVSLRNDGEATIHSVELHYAGGPSELWTIQPGRSADTVIRPSGESHLEIEFTDNDGKITRLNAGGYFEQYYRGSIHVSIKDGVIDENEQDVWLHGSRDSD